MKHLLICLLWAVMPAAAGDFRFVCLGEVTGLCDFVYDPSGNATTVKIVRDSDPECLALFKALQSKSVHGTRAPEEHRGAKWDQAILLTGEFVSPIKWTESARNTAPSEPYRDFKVTGLKVRFPLSVFVVAQGGNQIDGPTIMVTHFSFDSLFPSGLAVNDKVIDLSKHAAR